MIRRLPVTVLSGFLGGAGISRIGRAGKIFEWIGLGSQGFGFDERALKCEARYGLV